MVGKELGNDDAVVYVSITKCIIKVSGLAVNNPYEPLLTYGGEYQGRLGLPPGSSQVPAPDLDGDVPAPDAEAAQTRSRLWRLH